MCNFAETCGCDLKESYREKSCQSSFHLLSVMNPNKTIGCKALDVAGQNDEDENEKICLQDFVLYLKCEL